MDFNNLKSKVISFEGGEGAGKGTLIESLITYLNNYTDLELIQMREPGSSNIAEQIRKVILDKQNTEMSVETECLLYAAARAQLMNEKVFPLLNQEKTIIFDRFVDSSYVYQGISRNIGYEKVKQINDFATKGWLPNKTIVLDIDPKVGLNRIAKNNRDTNRLDVESLEFHYKIREGYLEIAKLYPERIVVIDANRTIPEILEEVLNILHNI